MPTKDKFYGDGDTRDDPPASNLGKGESFSEHTLDSPPGSRGEFRAPSPSGGIYTMPLTVQQQPLYNKQDEDEFDTSKLIYTQGMRITAAWILVAGSVEDFLRRINTPEEIVQFIVQQEDEKLQSILANEVRKNPQITIQQLQKVIQKLKQKPVYLPTGREISFAQNYSRVPGMEKWVLLQLKKFRKKPIGDSTEAPTDYEYTIPLSDIKRQLDHIADWVRMENPQLSSYSFENAVQASEEWHRKVSSGSEDQYRERNIVYRFVDGWTIQLVRTPHDLKVEGNLMGHCVGTYDEDVSINNSVIYSLRDPQNKPHATIEIEAYGDENIFDDDNSFLSMEGIRNFSKKREIIVKQIQGKENKEPLPKYKKMIGEWINALNTPNIDFSSVEHGTIPRALVPGVYFGYLQNKDADLGILGKKFKDYLKFLFEENKKSGEDYGLKLPRPKNDETFLWKIFSNILADIHHTPWNFITSLYQKLTQAFKHQLDTAKKEDKKQLIKNYVKDVDALYNMCLIVDWNYGRQIMQNYFYLIAEQEEKYEKLEESKKIKKLKNIFDKIDDEISNIVFAYDIQREPKAKSLDKTRLYPPWTQIGSLFTFIHLNLNSAQRTQEKKPDENLADIIEALKQAIKKEEKYYEQLVRSLGEFLKILSEKKPILLYSKVIRKMIELGENKTAGATLPSWQITATNDDGGEEEKDTPQTQKQQFDLEHYSFTPNLDVVDPKYYGTGLYGAERRRMLQNKEIWVNRAYFYNYGSIPEEGFRSAYRYGANLPFGAKIYDMAEDPEKLAPQAVVDGRFNLTLFEGLIKDRGYFGYRNTASQLPNAVAVFYPLKVTFLGKLDLK